MNTKKKSRFKPLSQNTLSTHSIRESCTLYEYSICIVPQIKQFDYLKGLFPNLKKLKKKFKNFKKLLVKFKKTATVPRRVI